MLKKLPSPQWRRHRFNPGLEDLAMPLEQLNQCTTTTELSDRESRRCNYWAHWLLQSPCLKQKKPQDEKPQHNWKVASLTATAEKPMQQQAQQTELSSTAKINKYWNTIFFKLCDSDYKEFFFKSPFTSNMNLDPIWSIVLLLLYILWLRGKERLTSFPKSLGMVSDHEALKTCNLVILRTNNLIG